MLSKQRPQPMALQGPVHTNCVDPQAAAVAVAPCECQLGVAGGGRSICDVWARQMPDGRFEDCVPTTTERTAFEGG